MFNSQNVGERGGSRPFVVGLVLLLLFLSTTQDWGSPAPPNASRKQLKDTSKPEVSEKSKEQIIQQLLRSNVKLEKENMDLSLEIFRLRGDLKSGRKSMHMNTTEDSLDNKTEKTNEVVTKETDDRREESLDKTAFKEGTETETHGKTKKPSQEEPARLQNIV